MRLGSLLARLIARNGSKWYFLVHLFAIVGAVAIDKLYYDRLHTTCTSTAQVTYFHDCIHVRELKSVFSFRMHASRVRETNELSVRKRGDECAAGLGSRGEG